MPSVNTEQQKNLRIVLVVAAVLLLCVPLIGFALYTGAELPPYHLRDYFTSASGHALPPQVRVIPAGTVPRGAAKPGLSRAFAGQAGTPPKAAAWKNPFPANPRTTALGAKSYTVNCAMCHGEPGQALGPVGEAYNPHPPALAKHVPKHPDGELYAAITFGIRSTPTALTAQYLPQEWHAFRARTSAEERWAIVAFMRQAFGAQR